MKKHIGSDFDDFLAEKGLLAETEAVALKRVIDTSRSAVDHLLDPENHAVTLRTLERGAGVLGKRLKLELT